MTRNAPTWLSNEGLLRAVKESQANRAVWQKLRFEHADCDDLAQATCLAEGSAWENVFS